MTFGAGRRRKHAIAQSMAAREIGAIERAGDARRAEG